MGNCIHVFMGRGNGKQFMKNELMKELFNIGKLKLEDACFLYANGYEIECHNGKVSEINKCKGIN